VSLFAIPVQRDWEDIRSLEEFLVSTWPSLVIELGTGTGAFSLYLACYCAAYGFDFHTFDLGDKDHAHQRPNERALHAVKALGGHVHKSDVFGEGTVELIRFFIGRSGGPAFIYCDNGDKPREVETYAPLLRKGDFLGVHDYGTEIKSLPTIGFRRWHWQIFEALNSTNRVIEKL